MNPANTPIVEPDLKTVAELAAQLRVDSIRATTRAESGHPTSCMSAADLLAVLVSRHLRYDWDRASRTPDNDHLILSKGHAAPLLYSVFKAVGVVSDDELMNGYGRFGSRLQAHPTPALPWVDLATGSLGQGLPDAVGIALAGKRLEKLSYRVWVLCGDSELAEGSIWEAIEQAAQYQLSNLITIVDVNRLGQRGATMLGWDLDAYAKRFESFGAHVIKINGHDLEEIDAAFARACSGADNQPTVILARTVKGRGYTLVEDQEGWHGRHLPEAFANEAIRELGGERHLTIRGPKPTQAAPAIVQDSEIDDELAPPTYEIGTAVATRAAYGSAIVELGRRRSNVVVVDSEVSNSTGVDLFAATFPSRFFEMYMAEQQLVATATGLSVRNFIPFASTFAAFLTRAHDFIRMAGISGANIRLVGSHAGVEIGTDGPSQMALEDIAMMRSVFDSTVLYPSDAVSTVALVEQLANRTGVSYLRITRGAYPVLYSNSTPFPIGGSKTLLTSGNDHVTLIGAGVTVHESIAAARILSEMGIRARVIDAYSIRPLDGSGLRRAVDETAGRVVVVEDHRPEGGLGEGVLSALAEGTEAVVRLEHLAVRNLPGSGTAAQMLAAAGIDADAISQAAQRLVNRD
ncbi:transketolase [Leifsonia soli]|uniref:Transketolase n=1 Tax=Leifsonia soli TaxID=582665 RepID=A0A852T5L4_9MICO|nr:transketolase [Leifsonia soli]NYD76093.1 transketolase [Leifsonia soli]